MLSGNKPLTEPILTQIYGLVPFRQQAIIWTNADLILWSIYAALGGDELNNEAPYKTHLDTKGLFFMDKLLYVKYVK